MDVQKIATAFKKELNGLKEIVAGQFSELQNIHMLEMQVLIGNLVKNRSSVKQLKLDFFDPKPSQILRGGYHHMRKPSRRYDEPLPEDTPLDTYRSSNNGDNI